MIKSNNPLLQIVEEYSDKQIQKILNSPQEYATNLTNACREEAIKRKLTLSDKVAVSDDKSLLYVYKIKNLIHSGETLEHCRQFLLNEGLKESQTQNILNRAIERPKEQIAQPYKDKDYYGARVGTGLFAIYVTWQLISYVAKQL